MSDLDRPSQEARAEDESADESTLRTLQNRLEPLDVLVPQQPPAWRDVALGVLTLIGVGVASILALGVVAIVEHLLFPDIDAATLGHWVAIGIFTFLWGLFSVGLLAVSARFTLGRGAALARRDVAFAVAVLVLLAAWTTALLAWIVMALGYVETNLADPVTKVWPAFVVLVVVALASVRLTTQRVAWLLLAMSALAIALLAIETALNVVGALSDGEVSAPGVAVGLFSGGQLVVLAAWWAERLRSRLGRNARRAAGG